LNKILVASTFVVGGYLFIKNVLPKLNFNSKFGEVNSQDYEDELAKLEADRLAFIEYQKTIGQRNQDDSYNSNWWLNTNIKLSKEEYLKKYPTNKEYFNKLGLEVDG